VKRLSFIFVFLLLASLILPSCTKEETAPTTAAITTPAEKPVAPASQASGPTGSAPAANEAKPKSGGILKIGVESGVLTLGYPPKQFRVLGDGFYETAAVEALIHMGNDGYEPWLAKSWEISPDGKVITLSLQKGVKYHDGSDFNAEAVKWNLDNFKASGRSELKSVTSVDIVDDSTVRLTLSEPDSLLLTAFTWWAGLMISPTAFKKNGEEWCIDNPVGTGPFKFKSLERDISYKFERFDDYWQGKPYLDGVEFLVITDPTVRLASFLAGETQVSINPPRKEVQAMQKTGKYNLNTVAAGTLCLSFDTTGDKPLFAEKKLRQALNYAIDREAICDALGYGFQTPSQQPAPKGAPWYNDKIVGYPYNPQKAKELLAEAGHADGLKLKIHTFTDNPSYSDPYLFVQSQFAEIGVKADMDLLAPGAMDKYIRGGGWGDNLLWFGGDFSLRDGVYVLDFFAQNSPIWSSMPHFPEIEAAIAKAHQTMDFEKRSEAIKEALRLLVDEYCVVINILETSNVIIRYPYVHDDGVWVRAPATHTLEKAWMDK